MKPRVLFVAETVTLAHAVRPIVLGRMLRMDLYDVILAADDRYDELFTQLPEHREGLYTIGSDQFIKALAAGKPLYDDATLMRYVKDDLALIERVKPDLIIGDFRLSLSVSARLCNLPYVAISNLYWSPYAQQRYPVPDLPLTRLVGIAAAQMVFSLVRPMAFALHCGPLNRVRKRFGLPSLGRDLRRVYTDADLTLYADVPGYVRTVSLPSNHRPIGPLLWSPGTALPRWWDDVKIGVPLIYVTLGSSGAADKLVEVLKGVVGLGALAMVATAGRVSIPTELKKRGVYVADFLPGADAVKRADLVICNGGSPATQQALAAGKPVLGLPSNLDQYLNAASLARAGVGKWLRSDRLRANDLASVVSSMLGDAVLHRRAREAQAHLAAYSAAMLFPPIVDEMLSSHPS